MSLVASDRYEKPNGLPPVRRCCQTMTATGDPRRSNKDCTVFVERCPSTDGVDVIEGYDTLTVQFDAEYYRKMREATPSDTSLEEYVASVLGNIQELEQ